MRALIYVRLSNLTDATTSPERQLKVCRDYITNRGWSEVGVAEDLDVSAGKYPPTERKALSAWLERHEEYDAIIFWRLDRLVRSVIDLSDLIRWSQKHSINLVSATESHFDLSTSMGRAIATMVAVFAEMELEAIKERTRQSYEHRVQIGNWPGGRVPYGYEAFKRPDKGWGLRPVPEQVKLIRELQDRILAGERPFALVAELNERGIPGPKGKRWRNRGLIRAITSPALLGYATTGDPPEILRDTDGSPIVRAAPVVDAERLSRVRETLDSYKTTRSAYRTSQGLLTGVLFCGVCEAPMYRKVSKQHAYYRCSSAVYRKSCGNRGVRQDFIEPLVEELILDDFGDVERFRRVWDSGDDPAQELAEVNAELEDLAGQLGSPAFRPGTPQRKTLELRIEKLAERQAALETRPRREAGYRYEPTGETFREWWDRTGLKDRNQYLRDTKVRVTFKQLPGSGPETHVYATAMNEMKKRAEGK